MLLPLRLEFHPLCELPPAFLLRQKTGEHIVDPSNSGYDIGLGLGFMARHFGARAVVCGIAHRILFECTRVIDIDNKAQYVHISYGNCNEGLVDIE